MKALKLTAKILAVIVILLVVALLALPLWIGPVAKGVANSVVPNITGTGFNLGEFGFNQYAGTVHVGDMQLANPASFKEKNAVELTKFDADFAVMSLFGGKKYRVESVVLDGLVIYSDASASNFRQIAANASGGKGEDKSKPAASEEPKKAPEAEKPVDKKPAKKGKGFQIDHILIDNVTLKYGVVPVKIPVKIEIDGIGADREEGASLEEVLETAYAKILSAAGAIGGKLGDLGKGAAAAVKNVDVEGAKDALKDAGKSIKEAASVDDAKDALKDAGKNLKEAVKVDDAKEALKDAGNNLKNLFK